MKIIGSGYGYSAEIANFCKLKSSRNHILGTHEEENAESMPDSEDTSRISLALGAMVRGSTQHKQRLLPCVLCMDSSRQYTSVGQHIYA